MSEVNVLTTSSVAAMSAESYPLAGLPRSIGRCERRSEPPDDRHPDHRDHERQREHHQPERPAVPEPAASTDGTSMPTTVIAGPEQMREARPPVPMSGSPSRTVPRSRNRSSVWTGPSH